MKKIVLLLFCFTLSFISYADKREISGVVSNATQPLAKVSISIEGKKVGTETDISGRYAISARPGDVLLFKYMGMEQVEVIVEDVTSVLNIKMRPEVELLKEVVIEERRNKTQKELQLEYGSNKNLIRTKFGIVDSRKVGFTSRVVHTDELTNSFYNIPFLLHVKFPGVNLNGDGRNPNTPGNPPAAYMNRTRTMNGAVPIAYEVDGILVSGPPNIPIEDIDRIALISGAGGQLRYGPQGAGGVAVINTKNGWESRRKLSKSSWGIGVYDQLNTLTLKDREKSSFYKDFERARSIRDKEELFERQYEIQSENPYFLLDAYYLFTAEPQGKSKGKVIEKKLLTKYGTNPELMKAMAYRMDEMGRHDEALEQYQQVFNLRPNYLQSYRDVANAYLHTDESKTALRYYLHDYGLEKEKKKRELDKKGIDFTMMTEANAILVHKGKDIGLQATAKSFGQLPEGTRILLEWSHGEAEFDLQLVNAENEYFTWYHRQEKNKERIKDEKIRGYSSEQFFLDGNSGGKWNIYLDYFGNKTANPTYFKVTLYTHYGTESENMTQKVFRFSEGDTDKGFKLFSVVNGPMDFALAK